MYERPKRCQNCHFFQQRWKQVRKSTYLTYYIDRRELTPDEINSIAGRIEYKDRVFDREGMIILPEKFYERIHTVYWHEYKKEDYGICRRYPPQLVTYTHNSTGSRLPTVDEDSFCGEWKEQAFDFFDANA